MDVAGRDDAVRYADAWQEPSILSRVIHRFDDVGLPCPERHAVAVGRQHVGQRRSPRARPDDGAVHGAPDSAAPALCSAGCGGGGVLRPNRGSSPRRNRRMFDRCVQNTNAATTTLTANTGDFTPAMIATASGSAAAPASDASDM